MTWASSRRAPTTRAMQAVTLPQSDGGSAEQARAWGLDDAEQLADFVEEGGAGRDGSPDWMNAVVPGLDRENDASSDDPNEYARPTAARGKEFGWVSDLVEEETGQMKAVDPAGSSETPYFRFSKQPAWLLSMKSRRHRRQRGGRRHRPQPRRGHSSPWIWMT